MNMMKLPKKTMDAYTLIWCVVVSAILGTLKFLLNAIFSFYITIKNNWNTVFTLVNNSLTTIENTRSFPKNTIEILHLSPHFSHNSG